MKEKNFKITLLMYIGILVLPIVFYSTLSQLTSLQSYEHTLRILAVSGGEIAAVPGTANKDAKIAKIDKQLKNLKNWFADKDSTVSYVGSHTPLKDYNILMQCWTKFKKNPLPREAEKCRKQANTLAFNIEKMISLTVNIIQNKLYMTLAGSMLLLLLLVFFIRAYMHYQARRQAIYDYETKLYNKKYLMAELKTTCARSIRHKYALSLLSITIENYDKDQYEKKSRAQLFGMIGGLIIAQTRESDVACRFDENHFLIILPFTDLSQAEQFEARIKKAFEDHDFTVEPKPTFKFSAIAFKEGEEPEACLLRAQEECCPDFH